MAVKTVALTCPNCGGKLQLPEGKNKCFCAFCGTQIVLDDGTVHVHLHQYDEAELKRIELEERQREGNEARRRIWVRAFVGWIVACVALLVVTSALEGVHDGVYNLICTFAGGVLLFGPIALFITRPKKKR